MDAILEWAISDNSTIILTKHIFCVILTISNLFGSENNFLNDFDPIWTSVRGLFENKLCSKYLFVTF